MEQIFYQDFIFKDMLTDERDFPLITLKYAKLPINCLNYNDIKKANTADYYGKYKIKISLTELMKITKEADWQALEEYLRRCRELYIVDDIFLQNEELSDYKQFYLMAYCCRLDKCCRCFIVKGIPLLSYMQMHLPLQL